jgi:unsaturated chondroitin disaccharide hydrolase
MTADWLTEALDLITSKVLEDEAGLGTFFPYVTGPDGRWQTMPASVSAGYSATGWSHGNWFSGFWIGLLLTAYLHRGDERYLTLAHERFQLLAPRAADGNTHDIGFLFWSSAAPCWSAAVIPTGTGTGPPPPVATMPDMAWTSRSCPGRVA